jgi:hypothetical protein
MKNLILTLLFLFPFITKSQTVVEFDNMETSSTLYSSAGWWTPAVTAGWFNNTFVSSNLSAAIYGSGSGTSGNEQDWYSLPNKTGLDINKQYQLKFRLSSRTFSNSTAATRGVDVGDFVDVQVSRNGGTFISELRITGNSNAQWTYASTGVVNHTANGTFTNSAAPTGDVYQAPAGTTTTAPSTVYLTFPYGTSQLAIDLFCRVNSAGEEWWIDNIELLDITPISLPVELISFDGLSTDEGNLLIWKTASEHNSDYFVIESSIDGEKYNPVDVVKAAGNSVEILEYNLLDIKYTSNITYYRLVQYDFDGENKTYGPISVDNRVQKKKVVKIVTMTGQEVTEFVSGGIYLEVYEDGSVNRIYK